MGVKTKRLRRTQHMFEAQPKRIPGQHCIDPRRECRGPVTPKHQVLPVVVRRSWTLAINEKQAASRLSGGSPCQVPTANDRLLSGYRLAVSHIATGDSTLRLFRRNGLADDLELNKILPSI